MPRANIPTNNAIAMTALTPSFIFFTCFWSTPNTIAATMNNMEMEAADAFA